MPTGQAAYSRVCCNCLRFYITTRHVVLLQQVQQELGITLTPWQESVIDMAVTLIQNGIAKPVLRLQ